jgi:hypothetical protein
MGRFANELSGDCPTWLGKPNIHEEFHGQSGYEAMGVKVPAFRKRACYQDLKAQGWDKPRGNVGGKEWMFHMVEMFADRVERDDVHGAMEEAYNRGMNVTCVYRTLAVILSAERPEEEIPSPATFLDLVR